MVTSTISMSLDGYVAGPNQSLENPLGEGGERLHEWAFPTDTWRRRHGLGAGERTDDDEAVAEFTDNVGAFIMGRKMFGGGEGPWDESWKGWWGEDPPYHVPVFVLTHHERAPLPMAGGTTFHFVTDGIESALEQARAAAADQDVSVIGGASTINQYLAAGLLDTIRLHVPPVILGGGERLFVGVGDPALEQVKVVAGPGAAHLTYRIS